jgi:hypothetical protein
MFGLKPTRRTRNAKILTRGRYLSSMQPPMTFLLCYSVYNPDPQRTAAWYTHINHSTLKLCSTSGQNISCSTQCFPLGKESKTKNNIFCYIIFEFISHTYFIIVWNFEHDYIWKKKEPFTCCRLATYLPRVSIFVFGASEEVLRPKHVVYVQGLMWTIWSLYSVKL